MATQTQTQSVRKHPLAECENCPLKDEPCAPTTGPEGAKVAIVSRSPGYHEARTGKPFSGPSGDILDYLLKQHGVKLDDTLRTNVVLCKTDKVPKEAIKACRLRLETEINAAETIIAGGPEAANVLAGVGKLYGNRGYVHSRTNFSGRDQRVIVTNNPAIVLHDADAFPDLVSDFRLALGNRPEPRYPTVRWTDNVGEARNWLRAILQDKPTFLAADIESTGLALGSRIVTVGFSSSGTRSVAFGKRVCADEDIVRNYFRPLFERSDCNYLWYNGKFDIRNIRYSWGINARVDEDAFLLSYLLDERPGVHSLGYELMDKLGWDEYEPESVKYFKKHGDMGPYGEKGWEELYEYNGKDTGGTLQLYNELYPLVDREDSLRRAYKGLLLPASEALTRVEQVPKPYDIDRAATINEFEVRPRLAELAEELQRISQTPTLNPSSPKQIAELIYDRWNVVHDMQDRKGDKERSFDKAAYNEVAAGRFTCNANKVNRSTVRSFAKTFSLFKQLDKQRSNYIEGLIDKAVANDGVIFCEFGFGTVTARLNSKNPNLQNITRGKEGLPNIRQLFTAPPDHLVLQADYSQAELRTIAVLSGDSDLYRIYAEGLDLHSITAERFFGKDFTKEQRSKAKNMNFGVPYGQSADTFQEKHDIPKAEAQKFIQWWFSNFKGVSQWRREIPKLIHQYGYVESPFGFRRRFPLITEQNRQAIYREGINFLPQNIAAWFTVWSLTKLVLEELDPAKAQVALTVHDSNVLYVVADEVHKDQTVAVVKQVMESAPKETLGWTLPFDVDITLGPTWGEVE